MGAIGRHTGLGPGLLDHAPPGTRGVGPVADDPRRPADPGRGGQERRGRSQFGGLPAHQHEGQSEAAGVAGEDGLRAISTPRTTQGVGYAPPLAPAAFWCARIDVPSRNTSPRSGRPASRRCSKARFQTPRRLQRM